MSEKQMSHPWDYLRWAVKMSSKSCCPEGMLIGTAWHKVTPALYEGAPSRALLFNSRKQARDWCRAKTIECAKHSTDWKYTAVRVRETIIEIQEQ